MGPIIDCVPVAIVTDVPEGFTSSRLLRLTSRFYFPFQIYLNGLLLRLLPRFVAGQPRELRGD